MNENKFLYESFKLKENYTKKDEPELILSSDI